MNIYLKNRGLDLNSIFLDSLYAHHPDPLFIKDTDHQYLFANQALFRWFKLKSMDEITGKTDLDFSLKAHAALIHDDENDVLKYGQPVSRELKTSLHGRSALWVRSIRMPIMHGENEIVGIYGILQNTTERKQLEKSNNQLQQQLAIHQEACDKIREEFVNYAYVTSHDLQEPMRKVIAFGDVLKSRYGNFLPEQGIDYLERIQAGAARLRGMIDDLLIFSRLFTREKPFEETDLNRILRYAISDHSEVIKETGAEVDIEKLPTIEADPVQMRLLWSHLLDNAIKFHAEGVTPKVVIRPAGKKKSSNCVIEVADNGIGIENHDLECIFHVFQTLHKWGRFPGNGIGLAVCQKIVQRHKGKIKVISKPEQGTTMQIELPFKQKGE